MSDSIEVLELVECIKVNLDNLAKMIPGLKDHPFFGLLKIQINECIRLLEAAHD